MADLRVISGQDATVTLQSLRPAIERMERNIMNRMLAAYRNPESGADIFYGFAAELSALDTLQADLRASIRQAAAAQQKDISNATSRS